VTVIYNTLSQWQKAYILFIQVKLVKIDFVENLSGRMYLFRKLKFLSHKFKIEGLQILS
jgi:hypothetical protein